MIRPILIALFLSGIVDISNAAESDTTSAKIPFGFNNYTLSKGAKEILEDVMPTDSSITLLRIRVYGYSDPAENDTNQKLSGRRAMEVKKYLVSKGINAKLITETSGKGSIPATLPGRKELSPDENRCVIVLIDYDAKIVERTIIIKSNKKDNN